MSSNDFRAFGLSDADAATLASIASEVERAQHTLAAAQADLTRHLARAERLASHHSSGGARGSAATDMAHRAIAAELACPLHVSDRTMQRRMTEAHDIATDYPATLDALEAGRITQGHVHAILDAGAQLPPESRQVFEAQALPRCERDTVGRVRAGLRILAERLHPRTLTERHANACEDRAVTLQPLADGMCEVTATLPLVLGDGIHDRLTRQATALRELSQGAAERLRAARGTGEAEVPDDVVLASDTRTMDQLRADLLADMLLTGRPDAGPSRDDDGIGPLGAIRAHIQVIVPALTVIGADDHAADLAGRGPIDAETARRLAGGSSSGWDRVLTHPVSGAILATDRYQPTSDLRRRLRARDAHCRFPGCRVPAIRCEHDHTVDHALGGPTRLENLAGLCQRHHSMKQFAGWRVRQLGDGVLAWTSPLGRTYTDDPPTPTVHFIPDGVVPDDETAEPPPRGIPTGALAMSGSTPPF